MEQAIAIIEFQQKIKIQVILPRDDTYGKECSIYNGMIVKCKNKKDIQSAVDFARTEGIEVPVRGGGHNDAGLALVDDRMVSDLSLMKDIQIDPDPENADKVIKLCKDYYDGLISHADGGAFINFMMEEGQDCREASYGDNYGRLQKVKAKYDPNNFFHINQNIKPE